MNTPQRALLFGRRTLIREAGKHRRVLRAPQ